MAFFNGPKFHLLGRWNRVPGQDIIPEASPTLSPEPCSTNQGKISRLDIIPEASPALQFMVRYTDGDSEHVPYNVMVSPGPRTLTNECKESFLVEPRALTHLRSVDGQAGGEKTQKTLKIRNWSLMTQLRPSTTFLQNRLLERRGELCGKYMQQQQSRRK